MKSFSGAARKRQALAISEGRPHVLTDVGYGLTVSANGSLHSVSIRTDTVYSNIIITERQCKVHVSTKQSPLEAA